MKNRRYEEPNEVYAIVFGHVAKTFGKVQTSKFNKIVEELGYDRVNGKGLRELAERFESDEVLDDLVQKATDGELGIEDLHSYETDRKPFEEEDKLFKVITPYQVQHQRNLQANREFNYIQRTGAYTKMLFEDLKDALLEELKGLDLSTPKKDYSMELTEEGKTLVVLISDFHIGATIEDSYHHGGYNYEILHKRLEELLTEAEKLSQSFPVEDVVCLFLGDMIEGADMRGGQKWGLEYTLAEQIAKGTKTLATVINRLENIAPVTFGAIRGNHDRLTGQANKKDSIYNDSAMYIILDTLMMLQEQGALQNTEILDNLEDMYDLDVEVRGKIIHTNHGDMLKGKGSHFAKFIKNYIIDILVTGHVHNFNIRQDEGERFHVVVGSPMGYNSYSQELQLEKTSPSQTLMLLGDNSSPIIQTVYFKEGN